MNAITIKSIKDIETIERTQSFPELMPHKTTYESIRAGALKAPNKAAIAFFLSGDQYDKPDYISYSELMRNITRTANFFRGIGLEDNDVLAFLLPNLPETHYVIWGGEAACQVLAINPLLEASQIKDLINSAGAKAVVTLNPMSNIDLWPKLASVLGRLEKVEHVIGVDIAHYVSGAKGLAARALQAAHRMRIEVPPEMNYHHFQTSIKKHNSRALDFHRSINPETVSSLFCTGGTTGLPKIGRRTHRNELANSLSVQLANGDLLSRDKVILGGLPLFHVNGALVTGLVPFSLGATVVMATPQGYRGDKVIAKFWDIVEHFKVNAFSGVPTVYSALMNVSTHGKNLSSLELGICGAAPMPVETFKSFQKKTGVKILEGYGCTEATCVSSLNPFYGDQKIGSIGLRIPFQEMKTVHIEGDKISGECRVDEIGTLVVRGPNVFLGYQLDHQNKGIFVSDEQGRQWLNTGDLARQDVDGYFWLTGRKKELIVRGGHNIEPRMIEEAMCRHPSVTIAAAVGRPDQHAGEVPVCYVQVDHNKPTNVDELLAFATNEIPERAAIPKDIYIVQELPLTAIGKVYKPKLEMQEIEKCIASVAQRELFGKNIEIDVKQDAKHGILAHVNLLNYDDATKYRFAKKLGQFTFKSVCS